MDAEMADVLGAMEKGYARLFQIVADRPMSEDGVVALRRLVDTADLLCTHGVARLAEETSFADLGHRDVGSWFAARTGARRGEGHARVEQIHLLELLPVVAQAVVGGGFSPAKLRCLAPAVTKARRELAVRDQAVFVNAAGSLDASQFALVVQRWTSLADDELSDPEQPGRGEDGAFASRRVGLSRMLNGSWRLTGLLDPLAGEAVEAVLAAVTPPPSVDDSRTPAQRRADGFVDMCKEFLANGDRACVGNERPNVNIVAHAADGSAQTTAGWFVRNWQLSQVLCDSTITAVAATLNGTPFDVGTPVSAIPVRNRKAVVVRDRCCRFPHCSRPARWCEIHHIKERVNGGCHELENLVLLCTYHHREVHRRGITLSWQGPVLVATMANGVMLHGPPHPATQPALI